MTLPVLAGALLAVSPLRVAAAPAAPRVEAVGTLPCSHDELVDALALRVDDTRAVRVEVSGERVQIHIGGRSRELALDGARGRDAARLIALAAADLSMDELPADAPAPPVLASNAPRSATAVDLAVMARVGSSDALRAGASVGATFGSGALRPTVELGFAGGAGEHGLALFGAPLRAGVSWGRDSAIAATAVAIPYLVDGERSDRGVLAGAGLEGRGHVRAGGATIVFAAGVDVLANQVEYRYGGAPGLTTPRVQAWTVLGIAWGAHL